MRNFLKLFTLLAALALVGCGASIPTIKPYKMDIQQGNVVTSEMLLELRPGMTKSQVRFIMGTPLLVDSFHARRWDYFYQLRKEGEIVSQRRVILDFENDLLVRVRGDVVPKGMTAEDVAKKLEGEAEEVKASDSSSGKESKQDEPIVKPIETPDAELIEATPGAPETSLAPIDAPENTGDSTPASVLAVPIPLAPVKPDALAPKVDLQTKEADTVDALSKEVTGEVEAVEAPIPAAVPSSADSSDVPEKSMPINAYPDKKRVFRLDRQLDTSNVNQSLEAKPGAELQDSVVQVVEDKQGEVSIEQDDPSLFERMLEKIGF